MADQNQQRKNLVFIHLESISNTILWQYRAELATVWRLMQQSMFYSRYQSAATSTGMALSCLFHGNNTINDFKPRYEDKRLSPYLAGGKKYIMLPTPFTLSGYKNRRLTLDHFATRGIYDDGWQVWFDNTAALNQYIKKILAEWREENANFILFHQNDISHMAFDDEVKIRASSFSDRFRLAYAQLDASINYLFQQLIEYGFWENTIIVCYGDHGDELWGHSLTKGFCHGVAPYASLTWTPLFIYENGQNIGVTDELVSAVDLAETLTKRFVPDFELPEERSGLRDIPFSGIDLNREKREFAFSQNLYSLQFEYADRERALTKSYSVTDGVYRLVTVSGGNRPKEGGLEFYYDRLDPTNSRNLLDFFKLGVDGDIIGFYPPPEATSKEFQLIFTPETVQHMIESFRTLHRELYGYVRAKEAEALKYNNIEYHVMPETAFKYARRRLRKDYDE